MFAVGLQGSLVPQSFTIGSVLTNLAIKSIPAIVKQIFFKRYHCEDELRKVLIRASKFLSLVLRHSPETIGVSMDANGWVDVDELIEKARLEGHTLTLEDLHAIVATNEKRRFSLSEDGDRIRANQGHSVNVDVELEQRRPPEFLFHGTAVKNVESIRSKGLVKGSRLHVHLSSNRETALKVGERHGSPIVLTVLAGDMASNGHAFFLSENNVWLVDHVPPEFIQ